MAARSPTSARPNAANLKFVMNSQAFWRQTGAQTRKRPIRNGSSSLDMIGDTPERLSEGEITIPF